MLKIMADGVLIPPANDFKLQLENYRLTTAEILYRLPDHPALLQTYLWQEFDHIPTFPVLKRFLKFWQRELEGKLYRVRIATVDHITSGAWNTRDCEIPV